MTKRAIMRMAIVAGMGLAVTGCNAITSHRGYVGDETLYQSVQPGLDNQQSVRAALGQPSVTSQFGDPVWYYIASQTEQAPFSQPRISAHNVFAVRFDAQGNVISTERGGMEQIARVDYEEDETPTLGRERGFLEDLFGNIGTVGGVGGGAGGGPGAPRGGGR